MNLSRAGSASANYTPALVAAEDVLWLALLIPLGAVFQLVLVLTRGYYLARRGGPIWATAYTLAVLAALSILLRLPRPRKDTSS